MYKKKSSKTPLVFYLILYDVVPGDEQSPPIGHTLHFPRTDVAFNIAATRVASASVTAAAKIFFFTSSKSSSIKKRYSQSHPVRKGVETALRGQRGLFTGRVIL